MKLNLIDFNVIFTAFWYSCGFLGGNHRFHKNMIYHKNEAPHPTQIIHLPKSSIDWRATQIKL